MGEILDILVHVAKEMGDIQRKNFEKNTKVLASKFEAGSDGVFDIVTQTDKECERKARAILKVKLPDFNIFGEELGAAYNGNGKVIIIDPVDGTWSFVHRKPGFGPIIAAYKDGYCIAAVEYNTLLDIMYTGEEGGEFKRHEKGKVYKGIAHIPKEKNIIYFGLGNAKGSQARINAVVEKHISNPKIISGDQDILNRGRVFEGRWDGLFFKGIALHDIAAAPLFARLTGVLATDLDGNPYEPFDFNVEMEQYKKGDGSAIYSKNLVIGVKEIHPKLLAASVELSRRGFKTGVLRDDSVSRR